MARKKKKSSGGLGKYRRFVKGKQYVKSADKAVRRAEVLMNKARRKKTKALNKAKHAWKKRYMRTSKHGRR